MSDLKVTYLRDHLAGAKSAVSLLNDLSQQEFNVEVSRLAGRLLPEIESDRAVLEAFVNKIGGDSSTLKEAAAWVAQKAGRMKLDLNQPLGLFEAVEVLALGVLGKLALWNAIDVVCQANGGVGELDLETLIARARNQHRELETLRLKLAATVLK
jgi:hypothetical protein